MTEAEILRTKDVKTLQAQLLGMDYCLKTRNLEILELKKKLWYERYSRASENYDWLEKEIKRVKTQNG